MGPAPIPPHERAWRHPSEIGPTAADLRRDPSGRWLVLSAGALTAALAVGVIVSLTPRATPSPAAVSATTIAVTVPPAQVQVRASALAEPSPATVRLERPGVTRDRVQTLSGAPAAIAATHVDDPAKLDLAVRPPEPGDPVVVLTVTHAYDVMWDDVASMSAPDGTVVVTPGGALVAAFVSGELRLLVD